jgi:membrane protein DedA with SNARE-associated domain
VVSYLIEQIQTLPAALVYTLVTLLVFGEAAIFIGFVLPGETAVIVGGFIASQGKINIVALCALVVVAAVVGDSVGYFVGNRYGTKLMDLPILRNRRVGLERALSGLEARGPAYVFIGRFTAFLRAVIPGLAGMSKMHYRRFFMANALGGLCWGIGYALLGYFAGNAYKKVEKYSSYAAIGILVLVIATAVFFHFRKKRKERVEDAAFLAEHPEEHLVDDLIEDEAGAGDDARTDDEADDEPPAH